MKYEVKSQMCHNLWKSVSVRLISVVAFLELLDLLLNYLTFTEPGNSGLQLVNGGHAVIIVRDESVKPAAELVFLLDDEMCDGSPSVISWLVPSQCHRFVIKVHNSWLSRFCRWL